MSNKINANIYTGKTRMFIELDTGSPNKNFELIDLLGSTDLRFEIYHNKESGFWYRKGNNLKDKLGSLLEAVEIDLNVYKNKILYNKNLELIPVIKEEKLKIKKSLVTKNTNKKGILSVKNFDISSIIGVKI